MIFVMLIICIIGFVDVFNNIKKLSDERDRIIGIYATIVLICVGLVYVVIELTR